MEENNNQQPPLRHRRRRKIRWGRLLCLLIFIGLLGMKNFGRFILLCKYR